MVLVRGIGVILVVLGLIVLGRDVIDWQNAPAFAPLPLSDLWIEFGRASLMRVEDGLAPYQQQMLDWALALWAAPSILVPGLLLVWLGRRREPRRRWR